MHPVLCLWECGCGCCPFVAGGIDSRQEGEHESLQRQPLLLAQHQVVIFTEYNEPEWFVFLNMLKNQREDEAPFRKRITRCKEQSMRRGRQECRLVFPQTTCHSCCLSQLNTAPLCNLHQEQALAFKALICLCVNGVYETFQQICNPFFKNLTVQLWHILKTCFSKHKMHI